MGRRNNGGIGRSARFGVALPLAFLPCLVSARRHFHTPVLSAKLSKTHATEKAGVFQHGGFVGFLFIMPARNAIAGIILKDGLPVFAANDR
jgi:hypothetical protein